MWRSLTSKGSQTTLLWRKLLNPQASSSKVLHKTLNFSSNPSFFTQPRSFHHKNHTFLCRSSVSEFENDPHDASSSSEEENKRDFDDTHVLKSSIFDENDENKRVFDDTHDVKSSIFDENDEKNDTHDEKSSSLDENGEKNDAQMNFDVEKLEKVLSLLQSSVDVDESLEYCFDGLDLCLNDEFVTKVVTTPFVSGANLISFFKWVLGKDFVVGVSVLDVFVDAVCGDDPKRKNVYALWDLVKDIGEKEKGFLNADILNKLICVFSKMGKGKAAFEVFGKFEEFGCVPNQDTYYVTIEALCRRGFFDWALSVCQKMIDVGMIPESEKVGEIISYFCKGRREKDAHIVYLSAKEKGIIPPQRAVNFLISCLSKVDETVHLAEEMLVGFSGDVRKHGISPFSWVVRGLCRKKDNEGAKKLLFEMIEKGPLPGNGVFNSVINSLAKAGDLDDAKEMLKVMESRGLRPDVYTYSVIMSNYAKGGAMEEACKVLAEAKKKHRKLCPVTFHTLIRGYCKLGEFDKALKLLSEMKDYGVDTNVDEYNKLIQSLCLKALDWQTAEKLLDEMKQKGLHLPGITRGLIRAVKELEQEAVVSEEALAKA